MSVAVNIHDTETLSDVDAGQGRDLAVLLVECHQRVQIHVGNAVAVGQHERLIPNVIADTFDTTARHRVQSGIDQRHAPRLGIVVMHLHLVLRQIEGHIRRMQEIIGKILFYYILFVAQTDHKIIESILGIVLHDMPENRLFSDLDHWLWF